MKQIAFVSLAFGMLSMAALAAEPRVIELHVEKKDGVIHWEPERVEVSPGEKVKIVAKNDLQEGAEFHGLFIPELKVNEKVMRGKEVTVVKTIPKKMKPGEYKIACQFHPKHAPATLVVKAPEAAEATQGDAPKKD